jgi:sulfite reductase (NADPH) flavoprotein alpha-component
MAKDVHQALLTVIQEQGKQTPEQATETLDQLRRDGRYQKDVY